MERRNKKTKEKGNGEGTLYFSNALDCWVGQYVEPNGKRKTMKQKKSEGIQEFKKRFNNTIASINQGTYIEKSKDTLYDILFNYIEQKHIDGITSARSHLREKETLGQLKKTCSTFIDYPINKITAKHIEKSKENMKIYSNSTISKIWSLLNKGFTIAISRRQLIWNPMLDETLRKPISNKETKKIEALSIEEEKKLLEKLETAPNEQYNDIIKLQLLLGARIGEVLALSRDCVNVKDNTLTIYRTLTRDQNDKVILGKHTKTYNKRTGIDRGKRTFPMLPQVKKIILKYYNKEISPENTNQLLFFNYNSIVTDTEINSYLDRINKGNCITDNLHSHRLRHTFITRCQERHMPLLAIQGLVGHVEGSKITNEVYTTISLEYLNSELEKIK